jgi:hypothetical protein
MGFLMSEYGERMARVETEVTGLKEAFEAHKLDTNIRLTTMDKKLDDLLALRNKGAGVVWLVSGLIGTGLIGAAVEMFRYFFGVK